MGCSRLPELENWAWLYCSLSVDLFPWSQLADNRRAMWPTFEVLNMIVILLILRSKGPLKISTTTTTNHLICHTYKTFLVQFSHEHCFFQFFKLVPKDRKKRDPGNDTFSL